MWSQDANPDLSDSQVHTLTTAICWKMLQLTWWVLLIPLLNYLLYFSSPVNMHTGGSSFCWILSTTVSNVIKMMFPSLIPPPCSSDGVGKVEFC